MKTIFIPPYAPTLMESTRSIGYSLEAAIADIIDNSIAASASTIEINFYPLEEAFISILDDGNGMDDTELNLAMQYGSKSPNDLRSSTDLGRFGLGLKTASLSQCRCLTVVSKKKDVVEARRWDIDYVLNTGEWSLIVLEPDEISLLPQIDELLRYESGTLVVWQRLDRLGMNESIIEASLGRKMDDVRNHLSLIYHRYLSGEDDLNRLEILINKEKVHPVDPYMKKKSYPPMDKETIMIRGKKVHIKPYILPHISKLTEQEILSLGGKDGLHKRQGFYIYRNKRLLVWGTWFKMMRKGDLSKLARIQVDITNELDELWSLDIKKSSAIPPIELKKNLQSITEKIAEASKRTWTYRGKKEVGDGFEHLWTRFKTSNGGVFYQINREHPLIINIFKEVPKVKIQFNSLLRQIEQSIPLNQLYVDLNNDVKFENENCMNEDDVIKMLEALLLTMQSEREREEFLGKVETIDPFSNIPNISEKINRLEK